MTWSEEAGNSPIGEQTDATLLRLRTRVLNDHIETSLFGRGHVQYPAQIALAFVVAALMIAIAPCSWTRSHCLTQFESKSDGLESNTS